MLPDWPKPWFTLANAERIVAAYGSPRPLTGEALGNITDGFNAAAHSLLAWLVHARDQPPRGVLVRALKRVASAARSFAARTSNGTVANRQAKATLEACRALPAGALLGLVDAAAGDGPLAAGEQRVLAACTAIDRRSAHRDAETARLASEAAHELAEWAMLAAGVRSGRHPEHDGATAAARSFALAVMLILATTTGRQPVKQRRSDTQSDPGSPTGPSLRGLEACFDILRDACRADIAGLVPADHPALNPGRETLFEWIRTAQGEPRRLRGPVRHG